MSYLLRYCYIFQCCEEKIFTDETKKRKRRRPSSFSLFFFLICEDLFFTTLEDIKTLELEKNNAEFPSEYNFIGFDCSRDIEGKAGLVAILRCNGVFF